MKWRIILLLALALFSCANDMEVVDKFIDMESEPDMIAKNVELLYTDSARLQMKLRAPLIKNFTSAKDKRDEFPEGIHVWLYEKTGELRAEITANWAKRDLTTNLYEARSNVVVTNAEGRKMETEQLFWDTKKENIYSEKHTKITSPDGTVATGNTFTSNQDFSVWELSSGKATIILKEEEEQN
jgi:LPS export ABC transporter protein LptC